MNIWILRHIVVTVLFLLALGFAIKYGIEEKARHRFQALWLSNGHLSKIQQESWYEMDRGIEAGDRILSVEGIPFDSKQFKELLQKRAPRSTLRVQYLDSDGIAREKQLLVRAYNRSAINFLFVLPIILSVIFFLFAMAIPIQVQRARRWREPAEVFSGICFFLSIFFMGFFPSMTGGLYYPPSLLTPLLGALILHLFVVYPKQKLKPRYRWGLLGLTYFLALGLISLQVQDWTADRWTVLRTINFLFFASCVLGAFGSLVNTLLTSRDFWARRRARVLSVVLFGVFVLMTSVFFALLWEGLKFSWERVLSVSLIFPAGFAFVFLKANVFDLERIFRRGLHQLIVITMGVSFALIVGLILSEWGVLEEAPWLSWSAIAIIVLALARPTARFIEDTVHRLIQTRVRYPKVDELLEQSTSLEEFLGLFLSDCEKHLNLQNLKIRFILDPTKPYIPLANSQQGSSETNEQRWRLAPWGLERLSTGDFFQSQYEVSLMRGGRLLGRFGFDGEDTIAFDPETSKEWQETVRGLSRAIEVLVLREFLVMQQGLMAVGRMQALLAHEMKNPLAIIKVCSGLLASRVEGDDESEELIRTIQEEVQRVTKGLQNIFDHSGRSEKRQRVNIRELISEVVLSQQSRFPQAQIEVSEIEGNLKRELQDLMCVVEREGLKQSLTNLVVNALEAGSSWVGIEVMISNHRLSFYVRDRGPGIPKEIELFRPFVTSKSGGTGLGLSHVKSFVERSGGYIRVQSQKNVGTSIRLDLPLGEDGAQRATNS